MIKFIVKGALVATVAAVPALAEPETETGITSKTVKEKKVCREQQPRVGSRIKPRPICKTPSEWARIDKIHKDSIDTWTRNRRTVGSSDGS